MKTCLDMQSLTKEKILLIGSLERPVYTAHVTLSARDRAWSPRTVLPVKISTFCCFIFLNIILNFESSILALVKKLQQRIRIVFGKKFQYRGKENRKVKGAKERIHLPTHEGLQ